MVMTGAMGSVLASKRARERDQQRAMEDIGNAMAAASGTVAEAERAERDRRQQMLMYEEEKQYERKMSEDQQIYDRKQADMDRSQKRQERDFNLMLKVAEQTGQSPSAMEAAGMGIAEGKWGVLGRVGAAATQRLNREAEAATRAKAESGAKVSESKARATKYGTESLENVTEAGKNLVEGVKSLLGGSGDPILRRQQQAQAAMTDRQEQRRRWKEADNAESMRTEARKYYRDELGDMNERGEDLEDLSMIMLREMANAAHDAGNTKLRDKIMSVAKEKAKAANAR